MTEEHMNQIVRKSMEGRRPDGAAMVRAMLLEITRKHDKTVMISTIEDVERTKLSEIVHADIL